MDKHRVVGYVVAVYGLRLKIELAPEAKSSSRATLDGVHRAVAINAFLTFDLGAGVRALGVLTDLEAKEIFDTSNGEEMTLDLTKPRRAATIQLLGTIRQDESKEWHFDPGITILPTLDTPAEVASPEILMTVMGRPPRRNRPKEWCDLIHGPFDTGIELGHQTGDENTKVKASFNDLFSRPLAIVGNTGSGKSFTVTSLIRAAIESADISGQKDHDPHILILDINGEYASAFLNHEERSYIRRPNEAYVNGKPMSVPAWLMNSEEISEWLSAAEQTQQPVLKTWWSHLKAPKAHYRDKFGYFDEAMSSIRQMYPLSGLKKNDARTFFLAIENFLSDASIDLEPLRRQIEPYLQRLGGSLDGYANFYGQIVTNGRDIDVALQGVIEAIEVELGKQPSREFLVSSGDVPNFIPRSRLEDSSALIAAAAKEDAPRIEQHLITLRMRLKARMADPRWSVFSNYESLGIKSAEDWFKSLGFGGDRRVSIIDLSMLAHETLPYVCAIVGRVLLEAREKLAADKRYENPWMLVLEEAHNYARPQRQVEDRGQSLSRGAFERVAKEGRKFGLSLMVASQRPSEVSPTIISQCANFFAHRLQNPDDIEHFRRIIPKQAQRLLDQVTVLAAGEAIVFGSSMHIPVRVQINTPSQQPSSVTSAPHHEWRKPNRFPVREVLQAWGI